MVGLDQEDILIKRTIPTVCERFEERDSCLRRGVGRRVRGQVQEHDVRLRVALTVVVEEEKIAIRPDRPAERAAELVVVVGRFRSVVQHVDGVVRVERLVAVELEGRSVQVVGAGLGDDVDHGATGAAILGGERVRVDLEFFYRVLAELIRGTSGAGAADGLAEERVVVVRSVDDQAVERAALTGEADVAGANIARDTGREQREVDEVAAVDGQVLHRRFGDRRADLRAAGLEDRRAARDVDGFCDARDGHLNPQRHGLPDRQHQFGKLSRGEAGEVGRDVIDADWQQRDAKQSVVVRHRRSRHTGCRLDDRNRDARHCGSGLIDDRAFNRASGALCGGGRGWHSDDQRGQGASDQPFEGRRAAEHETNLLPKSRVFSTVCRELEGVNEMVTRSRIGRAGP